MFEKEAEEYGLENYINYDDYPYVLTDEKAITKAFKDGAEFGYNKAKEEGKVVVKHFEAYGQCRDSRRIAYLEAQIEKMKCCENCKRYKPCVTCNETIGNDCDYYSGGNVCNNWQLN